MKNLKTIPDGFHTLTPYIVVRDAASAIAFYREAFGAEEMYRLTEPGGKVGHAELRIGNSLLMLADEYPDFGALSPQSIGGSPVKLHLSVDDVDDFFAHAIAAGATILRAVKDEFHGNRMGMLVDPYGHTWSISTQIEQLTPEEMQRRFSAAFE
ncbi:VOC family protein [Pseudolysobacter antarcticus]|uniref:VOC family protein n=1 Tax=Pseudolysobacter antarcticus TaxID=2511995 RepID=A0A411HJV0_9GAMM|nr:VOC family protein [Pseudolysobacter antarcticus]QBB70795.1 VOC family protein [Pseudolysobacter antarcticus]